MKVSPLVILQVRQCDEHERSPRTVIPCWRFFRANFDKPGEGELRFLRQYGAMTPRMVCSNRLLPLLRQCRACVLSQVSWEERQQP